MKISLRDTQIVVLTVLLLFVGCKKQEVPTLTTNEITGITGTSAISGGNIIDEGTSPVLFRGVCWSINTKPTIENNRTSDGTGGGVFTSNITDLDGTTTYYVRAYATNESGTSYGDQVMFKTYTGTLIDVDGNVYNTITIGSQVWMRENLKTTKYNDGSSIPYVSSDEVWCSQTSPSYCWGKDELYNTINEAEYKNVYGALYNWYAVNTGKLCPQGWHVPTNTEWTTLIDYLGGTSVAGGKLKEGGEKHWWDPNKDATNESGFTGLPGGHRAPFGENCNCFNIGSAGVWWTSTKRSNANKAYNWSLIYNKGSMGTAIDIIDNQTPFSWGFSIRCIKNI